MPQVIKQMQFFHEVMLSLYANKGRGTDATDTITVKLDVSKILVTQLLLPTEWML